MDYIAVNELKRPRQVRERLAAAEEMILTSNGRPMAVIMYVAEEDDPEDLLTAAREARMQATRQKLSATATPPMTAEEIEAEITAYRAERRRAAGA